MQTLHRNEYQVGFSKKPTFHTQHNAEMIAGWSQYIVCTLQTSLSAKNQEVLQNRGLNPCHINHLKGGLLEAPKS